MSERSAGLTPRFGGLIRSLVVAIVLPLAAVQVLQRFGVSLVNALALSAVFPAGQSLFEWLRTRRLDALGAISLAFIVLSVVASLLSGDARFALVKESLLTGVFGAICLGSLVLAPRPLMFYFGRQFATGGDPALAAEWDTRWQYPFFRKVQRTITAVWGVAYVLEAATRVIVALRAAPSTTLTVSPLLAIVITASCIVWTVRYARWAARRGAELRAQREAQEAAAPAEVE